MASSRTPRIALDDVGNIAASRTPGPLGRNDAASPQIRGLLGDTPGPLGINDHGDPSLRVTTKSEAKIVGPTKGAWNPLAAAAYLKDSKNGWAGFRSKGRCARAIRLAINAGGVATPNNPVSAAKYKDYLLLLGFKVIAPEGYSPKVGDIAVFPAIAGNVHGHIEMYTGDGWQSDYIQEKKGTDANYGKGFFANSAWSSKPFTIFRK